ncbi:lysophospholipid acyltransferase family protein [Cognatazoarcus halotolerans]|uniref:lysophospholipid acyltransferase family protein n=1 Tax=Cognatazoarcus halotolerans TaxID=2686016 RepID=UPI001356C010|nr:lysophospholipid acyltransferase family protein [Cognatazoarcus halotolerans]MBX3680198.1 lysophospholipid acyltransferase family protein [Rhodocyclaceae bacterium]MCB1901231.1 lysophospholipid acyltransferase family protein [Rhodocyclaceae bacterium]MCP5307918.1 lysophospholipid acyltransferase family protein [Zoogloeaceae bacterium]
MKRWVAELPSRMLVAVLWLLHWLPLSLLAPLGNALGLLLYVAIFPRRRVVRTNLRLAFPELGQTERERMARRLFANLGRTLLERGLLWWAPRARLERLIRVEGEERVRALLAAGRPVILMAPHFVGLDMGGTRVTMLFDIVSIYARQRNRVIDRWLYHGRSRFGDQLLQPRHESIRATVKAMKAGRPFYYLPDMDHGRKESIFVPFFGVQTATITGLPRFARMADAAVVPCVTRLLPGGAGYRLSFGEPWENFPSGDIEADVARMNAEIEALVRTMPEQYYWVHKRFKTRPDGEPRLY